MVDVILSLLLKETYGEDPKLMDVSETDCKNNPKKERKLKWCLLKISLYIHFRIWNANVDFLFMILENSDNQSRGETHNNSADSQCMAEGAPGKHMWVQEGCPNFWLKLRCITSSKLNREQAVVKPFFQCSNFLKMPSFKC